LNARTLDRFNALKAAQPHLQLFALLDGLVYQQLCGQRLEQSAGRAALFDGTEDAALSYAGAWLFDAQELPEFCNQELAQIAIAPHVSWLISSLTFDGLVQVLRLKLDVRLPDGSTGLLRFYDPRVMYSLATTMTAPQRQDFFEHIHEWHFTYNGQSQTVGRADA
jgi:Domain of unknown function (DUF4123)